jgi:hypothetical protein
MTKQVIVPIEYQIKLDFRLMECFPQTKQFTVF